MTLNLFSFLCIQTYSGPQTCSFPEKVLVKHIDKDVCRDSPSRAQKYSGAVVYRDGESLIDACPEVPSTMLDQDIAFRNRLLESANVSWVIALGGLYDPGALYKIKFSGWDSSPMGLVYCRLPTSFEWYGDANPYRKNLSFAINGTCDHNKWNGVIGSALYSAYFGTFIPLLYLSVASAAIGAIVKFGIKKRSINLIRGSSRTKVTIILLSLESVACLSIALCFSLGGLYSRTLIRMDVQNFFSAMLAWDFPRHFAARRIVLV